MLLFVESIGNGSPLETAAVPLTLQTRLCLSLSIVTLCSLCFRKADEDAEQLRREIYAKNAVLKLWAEHKMQLFHEEMCRQHEQGGTEVSTLVGFGV